MWPCAGNRVFLIFLVTFCIKTKSDVKEEKLKLKFHPHYCLDESHPNLWRYFIKFLSYVMVGFGVTRIYIFLKLQMWKYVNPLVPRVL